MLNLDNEAFIDGLLKEKIIDKSIQMQTSGHDGNNFVEVNGFILNIENPN